MILINENSVTNPLKFQSEDGDELKILIGETELTITNVDNELAFDAGGDYQTTLSDVGEVYLFIVEGLKYQIIFYGYEEGGLLFSIQTRTNVLSDFGYFLSENSSDGVFFEVDPNFVILFNPPPTELTENLRSYSVYDQVLVVDDAYINSTFGILDKEFGLITYFRLIGESPYVRDEEFIIPDGEIFILGYDESSIENYGTKFFDTTLVDYTRVPNTPPRPLDSNGVEIVTLVGDYVGIAFNAKPDSELTGTPYFVEVEGCTFNIDGAYDNSDFILLRPNRQAGTVFKFLSNTSNLLPYGLVTYETSTFVDEEFLRLKYLGYF